MGLEIASQKFGSSAPTLFEPDRVRKAQRRALARSARFPPKDHFLVRSTKKVESIEWGFERNLPVATPIGGSLLSRSRCRIGAESGKTVNRNLRSSARGEVGVRIDSRRRHQADRTERERIAEVPIP